MIPTAAALEFPKNQVIIIYTQYLETRHESEKRVAQGLTSLIGSYEIPYFDPRDSTKNEATEEKMRLNAQQRLDQFEQDRDHLKIQIDKLIKPVLKK